MTKNDIQCKGVQENLVKLFFLKKKNGNKPYLESETSKLVENTKA